MNFHRPRALALSSALIVCAAFALTGGAASIAPPNQEVEIAKNLKGSIKGDVYTSPDRDYEIRIPILPLGGRVRDQVHSTGLISQVIFTDDFGSFFRVVSWRPSDTLTTDGVISQIFHDIRDKKLVQTERGREWQVIDVEKEGAEVSVAIGSNAPPKLDLVTANAVFSANDRIYQVCGGFPVGLHALAVGSKKPEKPEELFDQSRKRLDEFLKGFKTLKP
jgi:hypothetical protein